MHIETIKAFLHAARFVPFHIHMADGQSYYVDHPDLITLSRGGRTLIVSTTGERFAWIETGLISRVEAAKEPAEPEAPAAT